MMTRRMHYRSRVLADYVINIVFLQQQAERGLLLGYDPVYSALLVKATLLDPTSVSTTTWSTATSGAVDMLTTPKQQPHKRELPSTFEGTNKIKHWYQKDKTLDQTQRSSTTTTRSRITRSRTR
eukprot:982929-Amphidinium_carterae.1